MKKEIIEFGEVEAVIGLIEVKLNYRHEVKQVHNRSTHDEEPKTIWYHKVVGRSGNVEISSGDFRNEEQVFEAIKEIESRLRPIMRIRANKEIVNSIESRLTELGFEK